MLLEYGLRIACDPGGHGQKGQFTAPTKDTSVTTATIVILRTANLAGEYFVIRGLGSVPDE